MSEKSPLNKIQSELGEGIELTKCRKCGCMKDTLETLQSSVSSFPQEVEPLNLLESALNSLLKVIQGKNARSIYSTIIQNGWVTELSHAAYLGKELARAELSIEQGVRYVQDGA